MIGQILLFDPLQSGQRMAGCHHHQGADRVEHVDIEAAALLIFGNKAKSGIDESLFHQRRQFGRRGEHQ